MIRIKDYPQTKEDAFFLTIKIGRYVLGGGGRNLHPRLPFAFGGTVTLSKVGRTTSARMLGADGVTYFFGSGVDAELGAEFLFPTGYIGKFIL